MYGSPGFLRSLGGVRPPGCVGHPVCVGPPGVWDPLGVWDTRVTPYVCETPWYSFQWLRAPECIKLKLAVIIYRALHGAAPQYLSDQLQYVADLPTRRRDCLRSSTSSLLDVRPWRRVTVSNRSFATAGPRLWNSLPADVRSASLLTTFRQTLKTHLFRQSYTDIVL